VIVVAVGSVSCGTMHHAHPNNLTFLASFQSLHVSRWDFCQVIDTLISLVTTVKPVLHPNFKPTA
jgi:hypothetical protein